MTNDAMIAANKPYRLQLSALTNQKNVDAAIVNSITGETLKGYQLKAYGADRWNELRKVLGKYTTDQRILTTPEVFENLKQRAFSTKNLEKPHWDLARQKIDGTLTAELPKFAGIQIETPKLSTVMERQGKFVRELAKQELAHLA